MAKANARPVAVFQMQKNRKIGTFVLKVGTLSINIKNDPTDFVTPVPTTVLVDADTALLVKAETLAGTHVAGSAGARDVRYNTVLKHVRAWVAYVQLLADAAVDYVTAVAIIQASGLDVKINGVRVKPPLAVKKGLASGSAILTAKAAKGRSANEWQQSKDGTSWVSLPGTLQAKTTVTGLTPGDTTYFRHRSILKAGVASYTAAIGYIAQ